MASPPIRILTGRADRKETKSFQTVIYPDEPKIQLCPKFKAAWIEELRKDSFGWLQHEDGRSFRVSLSLYENNCYMSNGIFACKYFGFEEPTPVGLTYTNYDNRFILAVEGIASNDLSDDSQYSVESVNSGSEDYESINSDKTFPAFRSLN